MLILALVSPPLFRGSVSYFIASLCAEMGNMRTGRMFVFSAQSEGIKYKTPPVRSRELIKANMTIVKRGILLS